MISTEVIEALDKVVGQNIFITTEPDILDFTDPRRPGKLILMVKGLKFEFPLPEDKKECIELIAGLKAEIYQKRIVTLAWNIKGFLSYVRFRTNTNWETNGPLIDLKIIEAFSGEQTECPKSYKEAAARFSTITKSAMWDRIGKIYQEIYIPLLTRVVPEIETLGFNDTEARYPVYPCYELEGQVNGRMKCLKAFSHSFNPHSLDEVAKSHLRPVGYDKVFLLFDYKHMEVSVLQWLSKDPALREILDSEGDVYKNILDRITTIQCDDAKKRAVCKAVFLPVIYGQGSKSVAERLGISESAGERLVRGIYNNFPVAMSWIQEQQDTFDANNFATDYFGRRRRFNEQQYKIRNFVVQAPASIICLHKLIRLHDTLQGHAEIVFHVHDGYGIVTHKSNTKVAEMAIQTLEANESLYSGLKLKVSGSRGEALGTLNSI